MNRYLEERLSGIRDVLMAQYRAGQPMSSASKGMEREIFINEFLTRVFPPNIRFGTGDIVDSKGNATGQIDIVVELPFHPSYPLAAAGAARLYMAEGVAAVLEIKSNLSKQWSEIERTVKKVKLLKRRYQSVSSLFDIPVLAVGYTGYKTLTRLEKRWAQSSSRPDGLMVMEDPSLFFYTRPYPLNPPNLTTTQRGTGAKALYQLINAINMECLSFSSDRPAVNTYL